MRMMRASRSTWLGAVLGTASLMSVPVLHAQTTPAAPAAAVPGPGPQELVQSVAQNLLKDLDANRAVYTKDPQKLRVMVDKYLLPAFDVDYSARLVLGKNWRTATDAQKKRFIDAFYGSMMRNYGDAILEFSADRLKIFPFKGDPASGSATVRTEVTRDNGTPVPVNYSLHTTPKGWKVWDVTIEGISYVRSYRSDFGAEAEQKGLDAVIQRLETQNASGKPDPALQPGGKTPTKP